MNEGKPLLSFSCNNALQRERAHQRNLIDF